MLGQQTETKKSINTVLLATDGTAGAECAFEQAVGLTKHPVGRLVITYYADPQDTALYDGFPCYCDKEWQAYGQRVLERLAERARQEGVEQVDTILEKYQGQERLPELAERVKADYITVGSHQFQFQFSPGC